MIAIRCLTIKKAGQRRAIKEWNVFIVFVCVCFCVLSASCCRFEFVCLSFTSFQKKKAGGIAKKFETLKKSGLSRFPEQTIGTLGK
jgi:hypothetical protein